MNLNKSNYFLLIIINLILKFLEQERCSDLLKFWIQAENFSRNIASLEKTNDLQSRIENVFKQWQSDAVIIYDKLVIKKFYVLTIY